MGRVPPSGKHLNGRLAAFGEGRHLLRDPVFEDPEVARLQPVDVAAPAVGHREGEHHHIHLHAEHRPLRVLATEQRRRHGRDTQRSASTSAVRHHGQLPSFPLIRERPSVPPPACCRASGGSPRPPDAASEARPASPPGDVAKMRSMVCSVHCGTATFNCAGGR